MSSHILSKVFTTTRPLELEYRKVSFLWEVGSAFETSAPIDKTDKLSLVTDLAVFADAIWQ